MAEVLSNVVNENQAEEILKPVKISKLKATDKLFVKKIVKDGKSGIDAYLETRDKDKVINKTSARVLASRKLRNVNIQQEISRQLDELGLTDEYALTSMQTLIDAGLANKHWTKPAVALGAIRTILELKDKFPAKKQLTANINMDQETMNNATLDELKEQMNSIQAENRLILDKLESNK